MNETNRYKHPAQTVPTGTFCMSCSGQATRGTLSCVYLTHTCKLFMCKHNRIFFVSPKKYMFLHFAAKKMILSVLLYFPTFAGVVSTGKYFPSPWENNRPSVMIYSNQQSASTSGEAGKLKSGSPGGTGELKVHPWSSNMSVICDPVKNVNPRAHLQLNETDSAVGPCNQCFHKQVILLHTPV